MRKYKNLIEIIIVIISIVVACIISYQIKNIRNEKPIDIIYISKTVDQSNEFWMALIEGARMAEKEYNVNLTIVGPENEADYEEQNKLIAEAIEKKPDAIMISPSTYTENTEEVEKIKKNDIKLVFVDSEINADISGCVISTNNYIAGQKMGNYMKRLTKDNTEIAIISHVKTTSTAIERERGIRNGLGSRERNIIEVAYCDSNYDKAYSLAKELIGRYPNITMLACLNEYASVGAANAIKELGLEKKITIIGFDNPLEEVKLLEEGVFSSILIQKPFNMGYLGVEQAVKLVKNDSCPKKVDSGSELITRENMYTDENQKILFPFSGKQFREVQK